MSKEPGSVSSAKRLSPSEWEQAEQIVTWLNPKQFRSAAIARIAYGSTKKRVQTQQYYDTPSKPAVETAEWLDTLLTGEVAVFVRIALDISTVDQECERYNTSRNTIYGWCHTAKKKLRNVPYLRRLHDYRKTGRPSGTSG